MDEWMDGWMDERILIYIYDRKLVTARRRWSKAWKKKRKKKKEEEEEEEEEEDNV
jgi:hypothetical protein